MWSCWGSITNAINNFYDNKKLTCLVNTGKFMFSRLGTVVFGTRDNRFNFSWSCLLRWWLFRRRLAGVILINFINFYYYTFPFLTVFRWLLYFIYFRRWRHPRKFPLLSIADSGESKASLWSSRKLSLPVQLVQHKIEHLSIRQHSNQV